MDTVALELILIAVLIVIHGFFSLAEFAIISIRKSRVSHLLAAGDERAGVVEQLQKDPNRLLATVQIGITIVGSTASAIGGIIAVEHLKPLLVASPYPLLSRSAEPVAVTVMVAFVSYLLLILGELVPKSLGLQYADTLALRVARPIAIFARFAGLVVSLLTISSRAVFTILRVKGENKTFITREEVQHMVAEGHETGVFSATEQEYIKNIFDFTHTNVREVMVSRTRMVALNLDLPQAELVRTVTENMYSRYPVYRGDIEEIAGFIHGKDLLGGIVTDPGFDISAIIRPPHFVPEGKKVNELLKEMQRMKIHMALVVDEYGGISGLVTTEDLLEELVGEIEDEHDAEEPSRLVTLPDGSIIADALISIYDLEGPLDIMLNHDLPYDTVAGLILDTLGRFPKKGEQVEWQGYVITCEEVTRTGIVRVRIARLESGSGDQVQG